MKVIVAVLAAAAFVGVATAAPAIVWQKGISNDNAGTQHISDAISVSELMESLVEEDHDNDDSTDLALAVFVLKRDEDGAESLGRLASSGALPQLASQVPEAVAVYHSVSGVDAAYAVVRDAPLSALEVSLSELTSRLTTTWSPEPKGKTQKKRVAAVQKASVLIVSVEPSEAAALDAAVALALDKVPAVIVSSIRSMDEVKLARQEAIHQELVRARQRVAAISNRRRRGRRLDDGNGGGGNGDDDYDPKVFFVNMTPNIFAGLLFTLFFAMITYTGISCMGMIAGQDVYVSKMPVIGREA